MDNWSKPNLSKKTIEVNPSLIAFLVVLVAIIAKDNPSLHEVQKVGRDWTPFEVVI